MKKENSDIDPLAKERDLAGKKMIRGRDAGKVVSPEALDPRNIKVQISIKLDADILEYFEERASKPGAPSYQTQINQALRETIERERVPGEPVSGDDNESLDLLLAEINQLFPGADATLQK